VYKASVTAVICGALWSAMVALCPSAAAEIISDQLTVYNPDHSILDQLTLFEDGSFTGGSCFFGQCTAEGPPNVYYIPDFTLTDPAQSGTQWGLVEADGTFSDAVGILALGNGVLFFNSDSETQPADTFLTGPTFPETGLIDITSFLAPSRVADGFTATFFSDPSESPEPGTLSLVALGILLLSIKARAVGRRSLLITGRSRAAEIIVPLDNPGRC
jgi:hypothetical protein